MQNLIRCSVGLRAAMIVAVLSICSFHAAGQGNPGNNAVYNQSAATVGSTAFIDASVFLGTGQQQGVDVCDLIYKILKGTIPTSYTTAGAVIDTRALSGSALTCTKGSPWSEDNNAHVLTAPSTILLPPTGGSSPTPIKISTTWILPSNTHLIGQGENELSSGTLPGTTIQANGVSGAMIQFGSASTCVGQCPLTGISVERLTLDGAGGSFNGIVNQYAGANSWVSNDCQQ